MKRVIRRVVTIITTEVWSVVDAESEEGDIDLDAAQVYAAEKRTTTEYTTAPGDRHETIETYLSNPEVRNEIVQFAVVRTSDSPPPPAAPKLDLFVGH